jgi:hypothetical protein
VSKPTPHRIGDEAKAKRYAEAAQLRLDRKSDRPSGAAHRHGTTGIGSLRRPIQRDSETGAIPRRAARC